MFVKPSFIRTKLRNLAWMLFNKLENNGNANFYKNGEEVFIRSLFQSFKKSPGKKIIFDIGAHIGEYSSILLHYSQVYSVDIELHLFEPVKACYKVLTEKFSSEDNIIINNFGASNQNLIADIFYDKEKSGLASLYRRNLSVYGLELNKSEKVTLRRLDEYILSKGIRHIDFVKIDVEGHELKVLEGFGDFLNSDFVDFIQFEYGGANLDSHTSLMELYEFFEARNFSIAKIMPKGLEIRKYSPFMENFIYANYVAISNRRLSET